MKRTLVLAAVLATASGCGTSPDELVKDSIKCWEEAAEVMTTITDAESAKQADARLQTIVRRMKDLDAQAKKQELAPDELRKLEMDNRAASTDVLTRVRDLSKKAMEVPGGSEVVIRFNRQARGM